MTSNEIRNIVEKLDVPKETQVFYDVKEITKSRDSYITEYWQENENIYKNEKIIAILAPKKLLKFDAVYFLDKGVVINKRYISYDKILFTGKSDFYHGEKYEDVVMICCKDNKLVKETILVLGKQTTTLFACDVIEKIIEKDNALYDDNEKIKYYINLYVHYEDTNDQMNFKIILYKKILKLTQNPIWIKKLVEKFGYIEFSYKYNESKKKREWAVKKTIPKTAAKLGTIVMIKNANESMANEFCKMYENILLDCLPYLNILQICDQLEGYYAYIDIYYKMLIYASGIKKKVSDKLIYEFNSKVSGFKNKIDNGIIELPQEDNLYVLKIIKYISDIYYGKIIDGNQKEYKYNFLKNADKAKEWLELYIKQPGCDNTVEYEDVMFSLADIYKYGTATEPADEEKMLDCLKMAANHGSVKASGVLAEYYVNGSEEKDKWVQLAKENKQKFKDKRSLNEKMVETVGVDINETAEVVGMIAGMGRDTSDMFNSVKNIIDTVDSILPNHEMAKAERNSTIRNEEREKMEHEQYVEGQRVKNIKSTAKNMKEERKSNKKLAKEMKKKDNLIR